VGTNIFWVEIGFTQTGVKEKQKPQESMLPQKRTGENFARKTGFCLSNSKPAKKLSRRAKASKEKGDFA